MREMLTIFPTFFKIGLLTFGGGLTMLPILQKDIAQRLRWSTNEEIIDYYAISQGMPGIVAVNIAMFIGYARGKTPGLLAAALGVIAPSVIVILMIAAFLENILHSGVVGHSFNGIRVAVAALVINAAWNMWRSSVKDRACAIIFLAAMLAFTLADISPILPVAAGAISGMVISERGGRA
jgi:chromate transporter